MNKTLDIPKYLIEHGVKPSYQRIRILDYFSKSKSHPTVNEIYDSVISEVPTLSKTTVYNTLNLFVKNKIIREILIEENEVRYDWATSEHGHFKCESCGKLFDIPFTIDLDKYPSLKNSVINERHVYFKGICHECTSKNNNN